MLMAVGQFLLEENIRDYDLVRQSEKLRDEPSDVEVDKNVCITDEQHRAELPCSAGLQTLPPTSQGSRPPLTR